MGITAKQAAPTESKMTPIRMTPIRHVVAALALVMALLMAACGSDSDTSSPVDDSAGAVDGTGGATDGSAGAIDDSAGELAQALRSNGMETLATAVEQVDVSRLIDGKEFTLFAPSDEAFLSLSATETADLLADPEALLGILRNHVVGERLTAADLATMSTVSTEGGETLDVSAEGENVVVGGASVTATDIAVGDGGVVHVIEMLLIP